LDLSGTQVTGAGLRALSALSSLRDLKLAGIVGLSARHLQVSSPFLFNFPIRLSCLLISPVAVWTKTNKHKRQALPARVEVLDLSNCSGPFSEKELGAECPQGGVGRTGFL
jgi:hypothetical protein